MAEIEKKELTDEEAYQIAMQIAVYGMPEGGRKVHRRQEIFMIAMGSIVVLFLFFMAVPYLIERFR